MISRLVLVGMVAGLGVTLPSWPECESWCQSAQEWASARLADWDTWRPREADSSRQAKTPIPAEREVRPVPVATAVARPGDSKTGPTRAPSPAIEAASDPTPGPQAIAAHPTAVADDPVADVALELNRWAEGLDIQPSTIVSRSSSFVRVPVAARGLAAWEDVIASCRTAEASGVAETIADLFEENPDGYEPSDEGLASSVAVEPTVRAVQPKCDPIEPPSSWDRAEGIAEELNRFAEGIGIGIGPEATSNPIARSPQGEPIATMPPESGIADELNRASEGLDLTLPGRGDLQHPAPQLLTSEDASGAAPASSSRPGVQARQTNPDLPADRFPAGGEPTVHRAPAHSGLDQAIRLTRDAAFAWMDVLKGPTGVTMTLR
ncbi:MAG TPA: hypothetical protein VFF52_23450 [Isosphaeraceae bacterium]|nr:hypothetical protein [Isosphaeraceae bacterium]